VGSELPHAFPAGWRRTLCLGLFLAAAAPAPALSQITAAPTPPPVTVADDEPWFQFREPILFGGNWYYPAGPRVYFNRNEMVGTGIYGGVMLYVRTTFEPYSVIFVPVTGGQMQPYERRRAGDLAGTVGSTTPSFPVESAAAAANSGNAAIPRAGGPPTGIGRAAVETTSMIGSGEAQPAADATTGTVVTTPPAGPAAPRRRLSAARPEGLNGIFVTFDGRRWFSSGPAIEKDALRLTRVGAIGEAAVYRDDSNARLIYVASGPTGQLVAPFRRRP
jgi:hypothetical protein